MSSRLHAALVAAVVTAAAAAVSTAAAQAQKQLIAPLDVRVEPRIVSGTKLTGVYNVYQQPDGTGAWNGDVTVAETWSRFGKRTYRVRGPISGKRQKMHFFKLPYLRSRTADGNLREIRLDTDKSEPTVLGCHPQGAKFRPGDPVPQQLTVIDNQETTMHVVDDPGRGRVIIRGPLITFFGPECTPSGLDSPLRVLPLHPPDDRRYWEPAGVLTSWQLIVPRAEFAAGGVFRFRGSYGLLENIEHLTSYDLAGTMVHQGKVAIDLVVTRVGR